MQVKERKSPPYDNAFAESFMKTLKYEEVLLNEYTSYREVKENVASEAIAFIHRIFAARRV